MNTQPATTTATDLERVLVGGDLSKLTAEQRVTYYRTLCESLGLNPLTRPFDYITLSGKLTLYAKKDATEQLRSQRKVSLRIVGRDMVDDCYVVTAEATDATGRVDSATGAVACANLKGEAKANALMKAETKAKRRVTLSICGLGLLDESETDSIPGAVRANFDPNPTPPVRAQVEHANPQTGEVIDPGEEGEAALAITEDEVASIREWLDATASDEGLFLKAFNVADIESLTPKQYEQAIAMFQRKAAKGAPKGVAA